MNLHWSRNFWLILIVGACVILVNYQNIRMLQTPHVLPQPQGLPPHIQGAIEMLQLDDTLEAAVDDQLIRRIAIQVGRKLSNGLCTCEVEGPSSPSPPLPPLFIITPTYRRPAQIPELTRLAQTLMHVPNLRWLVIEDSPTKTEQIKQLLLRTGLPFEHLIAPMPDNYKQLKYKPKGVSNRNRGLEWLRANATSGVFYFADDDNTYDLALFSEMRHTKKVSMWPVGLITMLGISSPIVKNGKFSGFYDGWISVRKFPVDMAGFAVSVEFLLQRPNATMPYEAGYEEDGFLKSLTPFEPHEIELKADNCTRILVWHTKTVNKLPAEPLNMTKYSNTNLVHLRKLIV